MHIVHIAKRSTQRNSSSSFKPNSNGIKPKVTGNSSNSSYLNWEWHNRPPLAQCITFKQWVKGTLFVRPRSRKFQSRKVCWYRYSPSHHDPEPQKSDNHSRGCILRFLLVFTQLYSPVLKPHLDLLLCQTQYLRNLTSFTCIYKLGHRKFGFHIFSLLLCVYSPSASASFCSCSYSIPGYFRIATIVIIAKDTVEVAFFFPRSEQHKIRSGFSVSNHVNTFHLHLAVSEYFWLWDRFRITISKFLLRWIWERILSRNILIL